MTSSINFEDVEELFFHLLDEGEIEMTPERRAYLIRLGMPIVVDPVPVLMEDEIIHTVEHPFCSDVFCPCQNEVRASWNDLQAVPSYIERNARLFVWEADGLLTEEEAKQLRKGEK